MNGKVNANNVTSFYTRIRTDKSLSLSSKKFFSPANNPRLTASRKCFQCIPKFLTMDLENNAFSPSTRVRGDENSLAFDQVKSIHSLPQLIEIPRISCSRYEAIRFNHFFQPNRMQHSL